VIPPVTTDVTVEYLSLCPCVCLYVVCHTQDSEKLVFLKAKPTRFLGVLLGFQRHHHRGFVSTYQ